MVMLKPKISMGILTLRWLRIRSSEDIIRVVEYSGDKVEDANFRQNGGTLDMCFEKMTKNKK